MANGPVTWAALGSLAERVARLEALSVQAAEHTRERSNRTWVVVLGILTGIVCPVIVTTVIAWLHLRGG
jgi:heme/copper-type cytochrome/quinol oxidase subunit 2